MNINSVLLQSDVFALSREYRVWESCIWIDAYFRMQIELYLDYTHWRIQRVVSIDTYFRIQWELYLDYTHLRIQRDLFLDWYILLNTERVVSGLIHTWECRESCIWIDTYLKGVFAKNERGYRLNAIKKRFWSLH